MKTYTMLLTATMLLLVLHSPSVHSMFNLGIRMCQYNCKRNFRKCATNCNRTNKCPTMRMDCLETCMMWQRACLARCSISNSGV
ncbi:hypothetical protein NP493_1571g02003 [Ridgeia piscesae]|uniref:Uncharacterized protein n=1 Tax=Ridgeia piscesae TaxID=27915 RepID=A0AAD9JY76_RIDPI|nr:hypothetical protein NP493_1571g02003 [Ridgeia piscesae]